MTDQDKIRLLREALIAGAPMKKNQFGEPCWCDTIAKLYCVGQPRCRQAIDALKATRENPLLTECDEVFPVLILGGIGEKQNSRLDAGEPAE